MTTPSPTIAFKGLRRRDAVVRYTSLAVYAGLAALGGVMAARAMTPEAWTLQALPPAAAAINLLGACAAGLAAYGWKRTCDVFNALKDGNTYKAEQTAISYHGAISTTGNAFNNIMGVALPVATLLPTATSLTQIGLTALACAVFTRATQVLGRSQARTIAIETGHPVLFRSVIGSRHMNAAYEETNRLHQARAALKQ